MVPPTKKFVIQMIMNVLIQNMNAEKGFHIIGTPAFCPGKLYTRKLHITTGGLNITLIMKNIQNPKVLLVYS